MGSSQFTRSGFVVSASVLAALGIFAIDILLPLGVASGVLYVALVLLSLYSPWRRFAIFLAATGTALTIAGFLFSPPLAALWIVLTNRLLSITVIWVAAAFCIARINAEDALQHSERHLREAQRITKTGHWIWNPQNGDLYWSDELLRIFGEELSFQPSYESYIAALHEDDKEPVIKAIDDALANITPYAVDVRIKSKSGEWKNVYVQGEVTFDLDGTPVLMRGTVQDITTRKNIEEALRDSEANIRALLEESPVCNKIIDLDSRLQYMSAAGQKALKIDDIEPYYGSIYPPPIYPEFMREPLVEHLDRAISSGKTTTVECPVHDIEGNVIWFNTTFVPARDSKGNIKHIIGTSVNITERKQAELELQDQMETQKLLLREIDHRVRNNLSSLLALVNLSCKSARSVDELAESIRSRTQAIASIHSVLANTKWRGSDLANLILAITKPLNQKSGVTLEGPEVLIPPAQAQAIGLIVNELVTNCLKYGAMKSESGRVEISWSTQPATEFSQSILSLEWKESGGPTIEFEPSLSTGTTLIMGLARSELLGHADLSFPREGARHSILITLAAEATAQYSQSAIHASPDPLEPLRSVEEVS